jgi:uncharacterized protein YoxC
MLTAFFWLGKILGIVRDTIMAVITGVINVVSKYPVQCACVAVLVLSNLGTAWYVKGKTTAEVTAKFETVVKDLKVKVGNFEALETARKKRIEEIEASSKKAADEAEASIKAKEAEMAAAAKTWASKLAAEIARRKDSKEIVYVTNPVTQDKVEVTLDKGEVVCGRLHDAFYEGINELVDIANKEIVKPSVPLPAPPKPVALHLDDYTFTYVYDPGERVYH